VNTRWIDEDGNEGDLLARVGRFGEDVRTFAIHTMGWIRIQEIVRFREIEFDPRIASPAAVRALIALITQLHSEDSRWIVNASIYTGETWLNHTEHDVGRLTAWIEGMAALGRERPLVPSALDVIDLGEPGAAKAQDPMLVSVMDAWRANEQRISFSPTDPFMQMPWGERPGRNVKVLLREDVSRAIVFGTYFPARTSLWSEGTVRRFQHARVLEQVPDRALAAKVVQSAEATLDRNRPRSERLKGLVRRSDQSIVHMDWMRVSLPAYFDGAREPNAVVVYCQTLAVEERCRATS
jgi:hypothetical protein